MALENMDWRIQQHDITIDKEQVSGCEQRSFGMEILGSTKEGSIARGPKGSDRSKLESNSENKDRKGTHISMGRRADEKNDGEQEENEFVASIN